MAIHITILIKIGVNNWVPGGLNEVLIIVNKTCYG